MENLVKKAKSGDSGAFAQLIRMNTQSMYKVAWAYLKNDEDVADAIQETILKCYEKLSTLKKDSYFKTWMIRILINNCCSGLHPCQQKLRRRKQDGHPFQKTACNPGGTHWSDIRCLHRFLRCRRRCIYFACFYHAYQTGSDHSFRQYQGQ